MSILIKYPNKVLKMKTEEIKEDSEELQFLIENLITTMECYDSLGIAANQLNELKSVFVMKGSKGPKVCINPMIIERTVENQVLIEGCLSFPQRRVRTRRAAGVRVSYFDKQWKEVTEELLGIDAAIFQHEYDHLRGKTMLDREYMGRA